MGEISFRPAVVADAETILATVAEGFESYRAFAPPGWEPPATAAADVASRVADPSTWCLIAEAAGGPAGHAAFMPAARHARPDPDPDLAHLSALFVRAPFQGTGLAAELLRRAGREASRRGFVAGRLFAPADSGRARRFYAREGWRPTGEPFVESALGLRIVELRLSCG